MSKSPTLKDLCAVVSQHAECLAHLSAALNRWWLEPQQFWKGHIALDDAFCEIALRAVVSATQKGATIGQEAMPVNLLQKLGGPGARILVWGNSGAGKSMLGRWLAWRSIQEMRRREEFLDTESRSGSPLAAFPLIVSLAKYAETVRKQSGSCSLEEFLLLHATVPQFPSSVPVGMHARAERLARTHWAQGKVLVVLEDLESALLADERFTVSETLGSATIKNAVRKFIEDLPSRHSLLVLSRAGWPEEWPEIDQYELQPLSLPERRELLTRTISLAGQRVAVDTTAVLSELEHGAFDKVRGDDWLERASTSPEIAVITATLAVEQTQTRRRTPSLATNVYNTVAELKLQRWSERWKQCPPPGLRESSLGKDALNVFVHVLASNPAHATLTVFTADADRTALEPADFQTKLRALLDDSTESLVEWGQLLATLKEAVVHDSGFLVLRQNELVFQTPGMRRHLCHFGASMHIRQPALPPIRAAEARRAVLAFAKDQWKELLKLINRSAEGRVKPSGRVASQEEAIPTLIPRLEVPPREKRKGGSSIMSPNSRSTIKNDAINYLARVHCSLCVCGDPGMGKSIALMMAARELCERLLRWRWLYRFVSLRLWQHKVPIFVALGRFSKDEAQLRSDHVREYVREELVRMYRSEIPVLPLLDHLEAAGKVIWIFDAVDEVSRRRYSDLVQALSDFANATEHFGNLCLFSCRSNDRTIAGIPWVKLAGLDQAQMAQFLKERLSTHITIDHKPYAPLDLAKELRSGRHAALPAESDGNPVSNPFLLKLFCAFVTRSGTWPASRVTMLQAYLEAAFLHKARERSAAAPADSDEMHRLFTGLARIAHRISELGDGPFAPLQRLKDSKEQDLSQLVGIIETARRCGILAAPALEDGDELVGFEHHRYDEFFSALYLHTASEDIDWMGKLESPRWLEIMQNLILLGGGTATAETSSASGTAVQVLTDSLTRDVEEHEEIVARKNETGANLSEGDYAGDLLNFKAETDWAFRAEAAARIVGQASNAIAIVRDRLAPATQRSLEFLIKYGHDETKVRLMLVAVHLPAGKDVEPLKALDRMAASPCDWVRNHDFELMVTSPAYRQLSEGRADIHCMALSELRFWAHSKKTEAALKKRPDQESTKNWRRAKLIYHAQNIGLFLLLILMALAGPFFPTYWKWGPQWWGPINSVFGYWPFYWLGVVFGIFCLSGVIIRQMESLGNWVKRACAARSVRQPWGKCDSPDRWFDGALTGGLVFFRIVGLAVTFLMALAIFDFSLSFFVVWLVLFGLVYLSLELWRYAAVLWRAFTVLLLCEHSLPVSKGGKRVSYREYRSNVWRNSFPGQSSVRYIFWGICSVAGSVGLLFLPLLFPFAVLHREPLDASIIGAAQQVGHFFASIWREVATPARPFTNILATLFRDITEYLSRANEGMLERFQRWANRWTEILHQFDLSVSGYTLQMIFSWAISTLVLCLPLGYYFLSRKRADKTAADSKPTATASSRSRSVLTRVGGLVLWLASLLVLFATIAVAAKSKAPPIPYASVWVTIIISLLIGYFVEKDAREKRAAGEPANPTADWVRRMWFGFSVALVVGTIYMAKSKPAKLPEPSKGAIVIIVVLGGIALAGIFILLLRDGFRNSLLAWRRHREVRRNRELPLDRALWLNRIQNGRPTEQLGLLQYNLDHLGLSTEEMIEVLHSVRSAIKPEARSAFGEKMYQVKDKWRHEKTTNPDGH